MIFRYYIEILLLCSSQTCFNGEAPRLRSGAHIFWAYIHCRQLTGVIMPRISLLLC